MKGNLFVDYVQGKAMKNLITLDTKQIISSHLNFSGSVTVKGNVDYLKIINGINLIDWYARSIFLNREQVII